MNILCATFFGPKGSEFFVVHRKGKPMFWMGIFRREFEGILGRKNLMSFEGFVIFCLKFSRFICFALGLNFLKFPAF